MTIIIATSEGMIADSLEANGTLRLSVCEPKIGRSRDGWLVAGAGSSGQIRAFTAWFLTDRDPCTRPKDLDEMSALAVDPEGQVWRFEGDRPGYRQKSPAVCGAESAEAFVLGYMAHGGSPYEAVVAACDFCAWVKGPVQVESTTITDT